jgi:beta-fructofuranosidase
MLILPDKWTWDFWIAWDGRSYHAFYLQADTRLGHPDQRHHAASIGHATSEDLRDWEVMPDAMTRSNPPAFDDLAVWSGSVIEYRQEWWMFYTGVSVASRGKVQAIGAATSADLVHWSRARTSPVSELDGPWYERLEADVWHNQGWRDPWVFLDDDGVTFHALVTARQPSGDVMERGVIGHAVSRNLVDWETKPPLAAPGISGDLEVPQLFQIAGNWYLLFSTHRWGPHMAALGLGGPTVAYLKAESPLGPFTWDPSQVLLGGRLGWFAGRIVDRGPAAPCLLAWKRIDDDGHFVGGISDPMPIGVDGRGQLHAG